MAYCSYSDVQSEFKSLTFGSATKITSSEVSEFIDQIDSKIDSKLSQIISTPVVSATSPKMFLVCKRMSIYNVAERCKRILFKKVGSDKVDDQVEIDLEKKTEDELDNIIAKRLVQDGVRISSNNYGISDNNSIIDYTPVFDESKDQW